eukprot:8263177-Lingulodinium_polyedra.AAC.1
MPNHLEEEAREKTTSPDAPSLSPGAGAPRASRPQPEKPPRNNAPAALLRVGRQRRRGRPAALGPLAQTPAPAKQYVAGPNGAA